MTQCAPLRDTLAVRERYGGAGDPCAELAWALLVNWSSLWLTSVYTGEDAVQA